jgi:hypothetical protein
MPTPSSASYHQKFDSLLRVQLCGIAPGAPIGGGDPPQPASIAAATQLLSK